MGFDLKIARRIKYRKRVVRKYDSTLPSLSRRRYVKGGGVLILLDRPYHATQID